jgi:hypothetical protein
MRQDIKEQRTPLRTRTAVDASGNQYELKEWRELVSINGSPWELRQGHGQYMTFNGEPLERISATQWELGYPPLELTLLE